MIDKKYNLYDGKYVVVYYKYALHKELSADELAVVTYLSAFGEEHRRVNIMEIRERFGWGQCKWQKISKGLREKDFLSLESTGTGKSLWFGG